MRQGKALLWLGSFVLLALAFSGCTLFNFGGTKLVEDGKPCTDIVIAEKPPRGVKLAASELQAYIEKISGAKLAITTAPGQDVPAHIYVGRSTYTDKLNITDEGLKYGAFRMLSGKDYLVLLGYDKDFVIPQYVNRSYADIPRALKEWDERTGAHWINPYTFDRLYRQYNANLDVCIYDELGSMNAVCEFLRGLGVRWYMPGDLGEIVPKLKTIALTPLDKTVKPDFPYRNLGDYAPNFDGATRDAGLFKLHLGLNCAMGIPGPHGLTNVYCRDEVKKEHPEFFANHRAPFPNEISQCCLASPEMFAETVKYARAVFEIYPDLKYLSLMPNDSFWVGSMCQCELCKGKATPERGDGGVMSDYVWDFIERVAKELYKTHPDRTVICGAYGAYTLPPLKIAKFSPNVMVMIVQPRYDFNNPETRAHWLDIRKGYLDKLMPGNLSIYCHYLQSGSHLPSYFPHAIAEDLHSLKGKSQGDYIELTHGTIDKGGAVGDMHAPGFNHLDVYVTGRYYWDADQDIEALLSEYYEKFYGPAAKEMKAFIEYSEANWKRTGKEAGPAARALELLAAAKQAAGDTVYGKRIGLVAAYCQSQLTQLRDRLAKGREKDLPSICTWGERRKNFDMKLDFKLDGTFEDKFWKDPLYRASGSLQEVETGKAPHLRTSFTVGWANSALYLAIHCEENDTKGMKINTAKNDDMALYDGDFIELLLETQVHSYYRIAIAPNGTMVDSDMVAGNPVLRWSSRAEVSTYVGDGYWNVELRIPMDYDVAMAVDPLNGVSGYKPNSLLYPFAFNLCRQRVRANGTERSAFSPTGKPAFYEPAKFGAMTVQD